MREAGLTLRELLRRRADLAYAVALALALGMLSLGLEAAINFIS
jgi:hypothetical protein